MSANKTGGVETTTLSKVPESEKKSWYSIAFIWAGNVICVPALMIGGSVSAGLDFKHAVISMFIGFGIVCCYMVLLGAQSAQLGVPSTVAMSQAFGDRGAGIAISTIIAVGMTGWFAMQTGVCASSFCMIMNKFMGIRFPLWLATILWGSVMLITAVVGIRFIDILNKISVPTLLVFLVYGVWTILSGKGAVVKLLSYQPETPSPMLVGITLSVGAMATGAIISGDYTRYCKTGKQAGIACVTGVIPAGVGALVCGTLLAICSGSHDITVMFADIGLPIIGLIVLILATWTTNTGNAYSSGIAVVNIFKLDDDKRFLATIICGVVGIILSLSGIINLFNAFLTLIGYFVPPVAGATIADYWILGRGKPENWHSIEGVNWIGIIAWLCGTAVAYFFPTLFIPTINGIVVSGVVYIVLAKVVKNKKINKLAV